MVQGTMYIEKLMVITYFYVQAKWKKFEAEKIRREREKGDKNEDEPSSF